MVLQLLMPKIMINHDKYMVLQKQTTLCVLISSNTIITIDMPARSQMQNYSQYFVEHMKFHTSFYFL